MPEPIVGIDLGTTNSEVAIVRSGQPQMFEEDGDAIVPSFVGVSEDGKLLVGRPARNQWIVAPERTIKSIKRKMGTDEKVSLGGQTYTPQEISAMILRTLKDRASRALGVEVTKAVVTVPAFFNDTQRQATKEAGAIAGLEVVRIINEPTAASLCYDSNHSELRRVLVYDLGGGTFDVSIVQSQQGVVEVLASHGDTKLGGDDFDEAMLNKIADEFQVQHSVDLRQNVVSKARLLKAVEQAKKDLSAHPFARLEEEFIAEKDGQSLHLSQEVSRQEFEDLVRPWIDRTMDCVQRALTDAKLAPRQIDKVVLVGGSTRTPMIARMLEERLGQETHCEVNPDLVVAMGAAVQAGMIAGENVGAVLVDVTPHSLGIRCIDYSSFDNPFGAPFEHKFAPILHRNAPLPASRSDVFSTLVANQDMVKIDVYQGENSDVRHNHLVGKFQIEGLARVPAGNQILVQLDLDLNGILKVSAREKATGLTKNITIQNALSQATGQTEASRDRLDRLWLPGEEPASDEELIDEMIEGDDDGDLDPDSMPMPELAPAPREGQRETVNAKALLEKAERIREKAVAEDQADLDALMEKVRVNLSDRQWDALTEACNQLSDVLFYLEE